MIMLPHITHIANKEEGTVAFFVNETFIAEWAYINDPDGKLEEFKKIYMAGFERGRNYQKAIK